jgi:hypothetical protein
MIYKFSYQHSFTERSDVIQYLTEKKFNSVLDIGFSVNSWSKPFTTHYVDIMEASGTNAIPFLGNISEYDVWNEVLDYVKQNGKFDFAICTHTLEDISSPQMICKLLPRIAKEGYIAVPSKYAELSIQESNGCGPYRGWIHHRWIFNKENDEFVAYPKLVFIEHIDLSNMNFRPEKDLRFFWKDSFEMKVINNDWLGPTDSAVCNLYKNGLLKN